MRCASAPSAQLSALLRRAAQAHAHAPRMPLLRPMGTKQLAIVRRADLRRSNMLLQHASL